MKQNRMFRIGFGDENTSRCNCEREIDCNVADILNGCNYYLSKYEEIYNRVKKRIKSPVSRYMKAKLISKIYENKMIKLNKKEAMNGCEYMK
jgi:hypothetical protein